MRQLPAFVSLILLCLAGPGQALAQWDECVVSAAVRFQISDQLIRAIAHNESRNNPAATHKNKNGTVDIGVMQVNSAWLPVLARYGVTKAALFDACTNIHVGAWILANYIAQHGYNWQALSAYNTGHPTRGVEYARKVLATVYTDPQRQRRRKY